MNRIFGQCISNLRKRRGRSQKFVALEANLDQSYLAGIERGRRPPPRDAVLVRLLRALEVTPAEEIEVQRCLAISRAVRVMERLNPEASQAFAQIAGGLRYCSNDELKALETIVHGIERRSVEREKEMPM